MRRPARRLFTLCSAASLMLCVAVCVLWVRSFWVVEMVSVDVGTARAPAVIGIECGRGGLALGLRRIYTDTVTLAPTYRRTFWHRSGARHPLDDAPAGTLRVAGFAVAHAATSETAVWGACVPCWFVVLATAWLPARLSVAMFKARQFRRRSASGCCPSCGYDLRATPGRCPECGTAAASLAAPPVLGRPVIRRTSIL